MEQQGHAATEDWTGPKGKHTYLCDDSPHNSDCHPPCGPYTQAGQPIAGFNPGSGVPWDLNLSWEVTTDGQQYATYYGNVNGTTWSVPNPVGKMLLAS